jgi:hypothetical protein
MARNILLSRAVAKLLVAITESNALKNKVLICTHNKVGKNSFFRPCTVCYSNLTGATGFSSIFIFE